MLCYLFYNFLFKTKDLNSIKNYVESWNHKNAETLQYIIRSVWCLCGNNILYKYQVALIDFDSFLVSIKILKDTKEFW